MERMMEDDELSLEFHDPKKGGYLTIQTHHNIDLLILAGKEMIERHPSCKCRITNYYSFVVWRSHES